MSGLRMQGILTCIAGTSTGGYNTPMAETSKLMIQSGLLSVASGVLTPLMKWPEKNG